MRALDDINLTIRPGDFVVALGASGCGKTTLLNYVPASSRRPRVSCCSAASPSRGPGADRGVVFQKHALLPWLNVIDNAEFGLKLQGVPQRAAARASPRAISRWWACRTSTST